MASNSNSVTVNVDALSNALAVAIQQATSPGASDTADQQRPTVRPPAPPIRPSEAASQSRRSAREVLPSFLKRKHSESGGNVSKKPKMLQTWDRDIVCLPKTHKTPIPYPRGKYREHLGKLGLIGKIRFSSDMSVEEVEAEIRSVFKEAMSKTEHFRFTYLQPTGCGSRSLTVPSLSSSFDWTAQQVAKLGGNKGTVYIMAEDELNTTKSSDSESEDSEREEKKGEPLHTEENVNYPPPQNTDGKNNDPPLQSTDGMRNDPPLQNSQTPSSSGPAGSANYRTYVDLIDLTVDDSGNSSSGSETDDLPPAPIFLSPPAQDKNTPDIIKAKHVLKQHQQKVIIAIDEDFQRIHVRRKCLFADALRAFSRPSFNVSKMLRVTFIGEEAVDDGGPRREFFSLLMKEVFHSSGLFSGWPLNVVPVHSVEAVASNKFFIVGKMMATSLVQGGQPPLCFAQPVADYLVFDKIKCQPCVHDIPDYEVREKLKQVQMAGSNEELKRVLDSEDFDFRFQCGYSKPTSCINMTNKNELINAIWLHHVFFSPHAELEQLRKGFRDTLQMEIPVCVHPEEMHSLLVPSSSFDATVKFFLDQVIVLYSDQGSNKRTEEEAVILHWSDYIMECSEREDPSLRDVLQFLTGANRIPAVGFENTLSIQFTDNVMLPVASTCALTITFSRSSHKLSYDEFKEMMDNCILGSCGFGIV